MKVACLTVLWAAGLVLAAAQPPRVSATADPNDPEKTRPVVPREEREKLGLTPKTWTGVVHPDVHSKLNELNQRVGKLKERLRKGRDIAAFDALQRVRFEGTVYVQVQLKSDNESGDIRERVLATLKASEIHAPYLFSKSPALIGYVTQQGLDKLAKNTDVVAICLDDKPFPEKHRTIYKNDLPPRLPADPSLERPGVKEGKVDPDVYRAFDLTDRVDVSIRFRTESLPTLTGPQSEIRTQWEQVKQAEKQLQNRFLSTVSAEDFWLWGRHGAGISGFTSRAGLERLWKHPEVQQVHLLELEKIPERDMRPKRTGPPRTTTGDIQCEPLPSYQLLYSACSPGWHSPRNQAYHPSTPTTSMSRGLRGKV